MKRNKKPAKASAERTENKGTARRRANCTRRMGEPILLMVVVVVLLQSIAKANAIQLLWTESDSASEERVPDPPANVRVEQLTSNSATIRWDPPRNVDKVVVRGYTLSYGADSTEARRIVLEGAETTEYALNGLRPNTTYAVSLTAYNEAEGEDSVRVLLLVRTPPLLARDTPETEDGTEALRPRDLRIERTPQKDAALLRWEEPTDGKGQRPLYYVISYASVAHPQSVRRMSAERSPALISDIKAEEKYTVKVRAIFADGTQSAWSEKVTTDGTRKNETSRKFGGGGRRNGNEEENFCGFELSSICDYIREGQWRWQRRNSTRDGFSMVLNESLSSAVPSSAVAGESLVPLGLPPLLSAPLPPLSPSHNRQFGRLMSPVYELRPSDTFCLSAQLKVVKGAFGALFRLGVHFEGDPRPLWLFRKSLQRVWPPGEWVRLSFQLRRRPPTRAFQAVFDVSKSKETELATFVLLLDNVSVRAANCPPELEPYFGAAPDEETEANLLIPLENLVDTDPRVYRTSGLDGLPAVGIKRGVEIVVPYRIYLPRKFYRNFAILASIRPADHLGGYLFAVLNAFDTVVELGVQLQPAGPSQTNISLLYTNSHAEHDSRALVSFLVPAFTGQWTQFALEVHEQSVGLYFRCMRFAIRQVIRLPAQLQMDDASKLYIANAGPILGGGFEGAIQELKLHDDPAEAANQCNENWWKTRRRDYQKNGAAQTLDTESDAAGDGSGIGPPFEDGDRPAVPSDAERAPLLSTTPTTIAYTTVPPPAKTQNVLVTQMRPKAWPPSEADGRWDGGAQLTPGPKGEKGDPGVPGTCIAECRMPPPGPPGLPGPPGAPGTFAGLSDADVRRVAAWPGVKGDKGECVEQKQNSRATSSGQGEEEDETVVLLSDGQQQRGIAPPYDSRIIHTAHGVAERKGQKGDKGDRGTPGDVGPPGPPGPPGPKQQAVPPPQPPPSTATVSVYQTVVELLAAMPRCPIGTLAFAISTQQLFLRVHSGWQQVLLDPNVLTDHRPVVPSPPRLLPPASSLSHRPSSHHSVPLMPSADSELSRLAYWLALDEPSGARDDEESVAGEEDEEQKEEGESVGERGGEGVSDGREGPCRKRSSFAPIGRPPPPTAPPAPHSRSIAQQQAQPWRIAPEHLSPKEWKVPREEETEKTSIRHKDKVIHLIALNEPLLGNFGGVRGADLECYRQSRQAGFGTTFRAFVSSRVQDLNKIVHAEDRQHTPVVNLAGERLFDSWHGVFDGGAHAHVPLYTFDRRNVFDHHNWSDRWLWHGSSSGGLRSLTYCAEWRSAEPTSFGMASPLHSRHALTDQSREMPCNRRLAVLCVEVMSKHSVQQKFGKRMLSDFRV